MKVVEGNKFCVTETDLWGYTKQKITLKFM